MSFSISQYRYVKTYYENIEENVFFIRIKVLWENTFKCIQESLNVVIAQSNAY